MYSTTMNSITVIIFAQETIPRPLNCTILQALDDQTLWCNGYVSDFRSVVLKLKENWTPIDLRTERCLNIHGFGGLTQSKLWSSNIVSIRGGCLGHGYILIYQMVHGSSPFSGRKSLSTSRFE